MYNSLSTCITILSTCLDGTRTDSKDFVYGKSPVPRSNRSDRGLLLKDLVSHKDTVGLLGRALFRLPLDLTGKKKNKHFAQASRTELEHPVTSDPSAVDSLRWLPTTGRF